MKPIEGRCLSNPYDGDSLYTRGLKSLHSRSIKNISDNSSVDKIDKSR